MEQIVPSPVTGGPARRCGELRCAEVIERHGNGWDLEVAGHFEGLHPVPLYRCSDTGYRFFHPATLAGEAAFYDQFWALENPALHRAASDRRRRTSALAGTSHWL